MGPTPIQGPRQPVGPRAKASALPLPIPWTKALAQVEPAFFSFYIPHPFPYPSTPSPSPTFDNQNGPQSFPREPFGVKITRLHLSDKYNDENRPYWSLELGHLRLQNQVVSVSQETDGTIDLEQL